MRRIVIVGNSAAALAAVESFRSADPRTPLTLISDECGPAYSRVLLPHLVSGGIGDAFLRTLPYYAEMGVTPILGCGAVGLDRNAVALEDGRRLGFDALLVATGARPHLPPIPGIDHPAVTALRTLGDAARLRALAAAARGATRGARAVVMGGGLVCFLVVDALLEMDLNLTILVSSDRVLSRMLDPVAGEMVQRVLEARGVEIRTGWDVREIEDVGGACRLHGAGGDSVTGDLVVVAKGVRANTDLVTDTVAEVDRGILVDERMRTGLEGVLAAGDVAETKDFIVPKKRTICATWFEAVAQGEVAGLTLAGRKAWHSGGLKMNVMTVAGVAVASVGEVLEQPGMTAITRATDSTYRKLVLRNERIVGAVLVGDVSDAGVIVSAVKRRTPIDRFSLGELYTGLSYASLIRSCMPSDLQGTQARE